MDTVKNLNNLLELPYLSKIIERYTNTSVQVDHTYLNSKQFATKNHSTTIYVFCYGDLVLYNPYRIFCDSKIHTLESKGSVTLMGDAGDMFRDANDFSSDLSKWNVENVTDMRKMFKDCHFLTQI